MNTPHLKTNWPEFVEKLKDKWPQLTDEDLHYIEGEEEAMFARVQTRTSATREEVNEVLEIGASCGCE